MQRTSDTWVTAGFDLQLFADPKPTDPSFWEESADDPSGDQPAAEHPAEPQPAAEREQPAAEADPQPPTRQEPEQAPKPTKKFFGRFDSEEEADKAYKAMQGELTRMRQGLSPRDPAALEQLLGTPAAPSRPQAQQPGYPQGYPQQSQQQPAQQQITPQAQQAAAAAIAQGADPKAVWADLSRDPAKWRDEGARIAAERVFEERAAPFVQTLQRLNLSNTLATYRNDAERYPAFREMEGDIAQYLQADAAQAQAEGRVALAHTAKGIEHAYWAVRGINAQAGTEVVQQARQAASQQVEAAKTRATVEGQRARQAPAPPKDPDEAETDAIVQVAQRRRFSVG